METLSNTPAADVHQQKAWCPAAPPWSTGVTSATPSLSSYKDYPEHRPFIQKTGRPYKTQPHTVSRDRPAPQLSPAARAFPETHSAEILSALRNLQEKIRRLELEKTHVDLDLQAMRRVTAHSHQHRAERLSDMAATHQRPAGREEASGDQPQCNQVLITQLAAAESRCQQLERQLEHMRRMVRHAKADRTSLLKQQVSMATDQSDDPAPGTVSEHAQLEKLERLEREYIRLTLTQNKAEGKIHELEMKLQEEEHQRKLVQDKAKLLQTGLEANRILLQSVSPRPPRKRSEEKRPTSKRSSKEKPPQPVPSSTQPHYRLSLADVPFVAGKSVGCSHSVRANVQTVLSLLKQHQPQLCNSRVLSHTPLNGRPADHRASSSPSSSSSSESTSEEELSELVHALQEELRLMSLEQNELMRRIEVGVTEQERKDLLREQEALLLKMERKGEQIGKLFKHKRQMKKLRRVSSNKAKQRGRRGEAMTRVATRGRSPGACERIKRNLMLLKDMRALQTSLRT